MERIRKHRPHGGYRKDENADRVRRAKSVRPWNDGSTGLSLSFDWTRQRETAITVFPEYGAAFCSPDCTERAAVVVKRKAVCRLDRLRFSRKGGGNLIRPCVCLCNI